MAGVSLDSVSNLSPDLQKAFAKAVQAEQKPLQVLAEKKTNVETKAKLLGDLIGKVENVKTQLSGVMTPISLRELAVNSGDERVLSATVDKTKAVPGEYSLEVAQLATPSRAFSNGFEDKDKTHVGPGYFSFTTASGETKEVFVDDENSTLEGLARTINGAGMGLRASVVNDQSDPDYPYHLVLSGQKPGASEDIQYPDFYFLDGESDFSIDRQEPASNAVIRYEGMEIQSPGNKIDDLIPGVTINLKGITEVGRPITLSVDQDTPKTASKVKGLVEGLNQVFSFIQGQNKMDKNTPHDKTLGGDYSLRLTEGRIRNALYRNFSVDDTRLVKSLGDIGIQFNRHGTLDVDEKKLGLAMGDNFEAVADLLTGSDGLGGIFQRLSSALSSVSGVSGTVLSNQKQTYTDRLSRMDRDIANKQAQADKKAELLRDKLAKIQGAMETMKNQSSYLAAQGGAQAALPGMPG